MAFESLISDEAKLDLQEQYLYYKDFVNKKVADNFFKDFDKRRKEIEKNPFYQFRTDKFRAIPLKKYPFLIFFTVNETEKIILIARIFHTSQNPVLCDILKNSVLTL